MDCKINVIPKPKVKTSYWFWSIVACFFFWPIGLFMLIWGYMKNDKKGQCPSCGKMRFECYKRKKKR